MHALIVDGVIVKYPYTIGMLRKDNPNTSFPKRPSDELLARWGLQLVVKVDQPSVDHTKNVSEGAPVFANGAWTQVWEVADATAEEIAERNDQASTSVREQRDILLADTDWMALSDNTLSAEWAAYRQALRDITDHVNFPYLQEGDWPVEP
jgi:hypothetical protein